eukprot:Em0021g930a
MVDAFHHNLPLTDDVSLMTSLNGSANHPASYDAIPTQPLVDATIRSYRRRWPVLVLLCGNVLLLNLNWVFFSPISDVVMCYYHKSNFWANAVSMCYMIAYVILVGSGGVVASEGWPQGLYDYSNRQYRHWSVD